MHLGNQLSTIAETLYRGPVKRGVQMLGIEPTVVGGFNCLRSALGDETVTYTVSGFEASFKRDLHIPSRIPEREIVSEVLSDIREDDVFYDLGANRGIYTCLLGMALPDGEVVAFEPNPAAFAALEENVAINGLEEWTNLYQRAASDAAGEVEFYVSPDSTGNSLVTDGRDMDQLITVEACAIDDLVSDGEFPAPHIVKIDVEGGEHDAIRGMESVLSVSDCRTVYCEIHEDPLSAAGTSGEAIEEQLRGCGFELEEIRRRTSQQYTVRGVK